MSVDKKRPIYVVGHKNPDTDSICSAIAYANLKNILNKDEEQMYVAARAGAMNPETEYVLKKFLADSPVYISDVMTQVRDMEIRETKGVPGSLSLKREICQHSRASLIMVWLVYATVRVTRSQAFSQE